MGLKKGRGEVSFTPKPSPTFKKHKSSRDSRILQPQATNFVLLLPFWYSCSLPASKCTSPLLFVLDHHCCVLMLCLLILAKIQEAIYPWIRACFGEAIHCLVLVFDSYVLNLFYTAFGLSIYPNQFVLHILKIIYLLNFYLQKNM